MFLIFSVLRCCHRHDCCYGDAERLGCQTKTDKYQWTCEDKTAECGIALFDAYTNIFVFVFGKYVSAHENMMCISVAH